MMKIRNKTFNEFCYEYCDRLYEPKLPEDVQSSGYINLKKMVIGNIKPATHKQIKRWENNPTKEEILSTPDIKYLRFLHPLLRPIIIDNWNNIKKLKIN